MRTTITSCKAALAISGCAQFEPRAMAPAAAVAAYEARTLESAELHAFIQQNTRREPGNWPPAQWDFELLTLAAFYYHPDLDVARAKWNVAQAASQTAGMRLAGVKATKPRRAWLRACSAGAQQPSQSAITPG